VRKSCLTFVVITFLISIFSYADTEIAYYAMTPVKPTRHVFPLPEGLSRLTCGIVYAPGHYFLPDAVGATFNQNEIEKSIEQSIRDNMQNTHSIKNIVTDSDKNITIYFKATIGPACLLDMVRGCHSLFDGGPAYTYQLSIIDNVTGDSATVEKMVRGTYKLTKIQDITLKLKRLVRFSEIGNETFSSVGTFCRVSEE
jgi:hypothetical protein